MDLKGIYLGCIVLQVVSETVMKCVKKQSDLAGRTKAEKAAKQVLEFLLTSFSAFHPFELAHKS